jgi:hypothetical protein
VLGRFTEGGENVQALLGKVTAGYGTSSQSVQNLGVFNIPLVSWNSWTTTYLTDNNSNLVTVTFDGSLTTLQFNGSPMNPSVPDTINADYFYLLPASAAPVPTLTATVNGGVITLWFATVTGHTYQVLYKNNLTDSSWSTLGGSVSGNNAVQTATDSAANGHRFYRVQVQ